MNLLLVDDEEIVFKSVGRFLSRCGHRVRESLDGIDALREMEEDVPDVVISDIRMPGMDGLQLLGAIKVRFPATPVILITGHGDVDTAVSALQEGAYDYVRKPVKLEKLVTILERIDERKRLETTLMQERAKLVHAGRLATVGTLAAGVAHEINNPNTMIRGNLQTFERLWERVEATLQCLCAEENEDSDLAIFIDEMPGLVSSMLAGTERIARIVNQVKLFSRNDDGTPPEQVDLSACLDEAIGLTEASLHGVRVEKVYAEGDVLGVAQELTQVFVNLLHNAAQAVGNQPDGRVVIEMAVDKSGWVDVSVADNGPGIPERMHDKVFDPFFTTKAPGQGTGLGLSICHSIVSEHGGHIGFDREVQDGARFWVRLPSAVATIARHIEALAV